MPEETKDEKILRECQASGEPFIVFRAKDSLAVELLHHYQIMAIQHGCTDEFIEGVNSRMNEFDQWGSENPDRMKIPD